jgi:hypothetical protein
MWILQNFQLCIFQFWANKTLDPDPQHCFKKKETLSVTFSTFCLEVKRTKGPGEEASPLEGLLVRGLWFDPGDVHHLVQDVQHRAKHCAPRRSHATIV